MLVKFDLPNNLKKDDLLIYNGKKFVTYDVNKINNELISHIGKLEERINLLEQRINKNIEEEIRKVIAK